MGRKSSKCGLFSHNGTTGAIRRWCVGYAANRKEKQLPTTSKRSRVFDEENKFVGWDVHAETIVVAGSGGPREYGPWE